MVRERQGTFSGRSLERKEPPRVYAEHLHPGELLALREFGSSCFYDGENGGKDKRAIYSGPNPWTP